MSREDFIGRKFYMLTALRDVEDDVTTGGQTRRAIEWRCDCGNAVVRLLTRVKKGEVKSCGCYKWKKPNRDAAPVGETFGRLTVLREVEPAFVSTTGKKKRRVLCRCSCGQEKSCELVSIKRGVVSSCGCISKELRTTHGQYKSGAYASWKSLISRGTGRSCPENYYDRGIRVCERWKDFKNFYEDMGDRPEGMSIDRVDNDGDYEPTNCRWATMKQQLRNRRITHFIQYKGKKTTVPDLAENLGMDRKFLENRISRWGSVERAVNQPKQKRTSNRV